MAKHSHTDLLIIGAGPAGLMAAAWASQYGVTTRFIDDKPGKVKTGHADGLTCRTLEILDSFGMADTVLKEASFDVEMRSWVSSRLNFVYDLFFEEWSRQKTHPEPCVDARLSYRRNLD